MKPEFRLYSEHANRGSPAEEFHLLCTGTNAAIESAASAHFAGKCAVSCRHEDTERSHASTTELFCKAAEKLKLERR